VCVYGAISRVRRVCGWLPSGQARTGGVVVVEETGAAEHQQTLGEAGSEASSAGRVGGGMQIRTVLPWRPCVGDEDESLDAGSGARSQEEMQKQVTRDCLKPAAAACAEGGAGSEASLLRKARGILQQCVPATLSGGNFGDARCVCVCVCARMCLCVYVCVYAFTHIRLQVH
jgi:hypothetical protein